MPRSAAFTLLGSLLLAAGLLAVAALPAGAAPGTTTPGAAGVPVATTPTTTPKPKTVHLRLKTHQDFTPTGVVLKVGDNVTITTSGTIVFGGGLTSQQSPAGVAWGKPCNAVFAGTHQRQRPWPTPGLRCWSMVGRVGAGAPFEVGTGTTFRATQAGPLILGVNDNFVRDNQGNWFATIRVLPPGAVAPPAVVPTKKKSSSTTLFVLIGALLVLVILVIALLAMRRRRGDVAEPEPEPVLVGATAAAAAPMAAPAMVPEVAPIPTGPANVAPLPESIDVNIFEVEFSNGLTMRVGYNHFPEGVDLRWRVTQNRVPVAVGRFVTKGGGSTNHFETVPLGVKLEGRNTQPDGADVQFDWTINDVPFRYSVRRDPNC